MAPARWSTESYLRTVWMIFYGVAVTVTAFRLIHRQRRKQSSWDDFWALVAVSCNTVSAIGSCLRLTWNRTFAVNASHPPPKAVTLATNFVMLLAFTCAVWISIACSILRILPRGRTRKLVLFVTWLFALTASGLLFAKSWICGRNMAWVVDCPRGKGYNIAKLITDVIADATLVTIPLYILWYSDLPKAPRLMIRVVFAMRLLSTAVSVVYAIYGMGPDRFLDGATPHIESATNLIICNLLVLVTFVYRRFRNGRDLDDEVTAYVTTRTPRARRAPLTFMSFTNITQSEFTTFLSTKRRGSSIFLEATPSTDAAHHVHPSVASSLNSLEHLESTAVGKVTPQRTTLTPFSGSDIGKAGLPPEP